MTMLPRLLAAPIIAAGIALTAGANAQTSAPSAAPSMSPPSTSAKIPDKKLDAVAAAAKKVVVLNRSYKQKIDQASAAQKEQLTSEANEAMTKAVTDQGLSVQEYLSIMQVAQNDPTVRDRLLQRMK